MKKNSHIEILPTTQELFEKAADFIVQKGQEAIDARGVFTIALSGGSTPPKLYKALVRHHKKSKIWQKTAFFWSDERPVKPDHADSNAGTALKYLITPLTISQEQVFTVPTDRIPIQRVADDYEDDISDFFHQHNMDPRFDLILLGLGEDGHTASLFPHTPALNETKKLVAANWIEKLNSWRITFTFPLINQSRQVLFLVSGKNKAGIVNKVLGTKDKHYPAQNVNPAFGDCAWYFDSEAAALLIRGA